MLSKEIMTFRASTKIDFDSIYLDCNIMIFFLNADISYCIGDQNNPYTLALIQTIFYT